MMILYCYDKAIAGNRGKMVLISVFICQYLVSTVFCIAEAYTRRAV